MVKGWFHIQNYCQAKVNIQIKVLNYKFKPAHKILLFVNKLLKRKDKMLLLM